MVGEQPVPDREPPVHAEIDNADVHGGAEFELEVEVVQMDQVLMNDDDFEVIEVHLDDDNVEFIEVRMDDVDVPGQVEVVVPDHDEGIELGVILQPVDEEVSEYLFILILMKNKICYNFVN